MIDILLILGVLALSLGILGYKIRKQVNGESKCSSCELDCPLQGGDFKIETNDLELDDNKSQ